MANDAIDITIMHTSFATGYFQLGSIRSTEFKRVFSRVRPGEASLYRVIGTDDPAGPTVIF